MKSAMAAEKTSRQLTEVLNQAQLFKLDVDLLKSRVGECIKARVDAMSLDTEQS